MEHVVAAFCVERGLPVPLLVHTGSSAVFRSGDVAIRATSSTRNPATLTDADIVAASVALRSNGCAVVEASSSEVIERDGVMLTFWQWVDEVPDVRTDSSAWGHVGATLRTIHGTDTGLELGQLGDVLAARLEARLRLLRSSRPTWLSMSTLTLLHDVTAELLLTLPTAAAGAETVHGDFHHGNVLWSSPVPVVSDLEGLAVGNGAYDLAVLTEREVCYGLGEGFVAALVDGYGADLRTRPRFDVLVRTKQMISTQWCVVQALRLPAFEAEAQKRCDWWVNGGGPVWVTNPGAIR